MKKPAKLKYPGGKDRVYLLTFKNLWRYLLSMTLLLSIVPFYSGCSFAPSDDSGGTGSEIVGKTEYPDSTATQKKVALPKLLAANGLPVIGGKIFVYPRSFIPDTAWATRGALPRVFTDTAGMFRVEDVPRGVVVVEGNDGNGRGIVTTVNVTQDSTTYDAGVLYLQKTGAVTIQAHTSLPGSVRFYVSIKGTRCVVRGTSAGVDVMLGDIPTGISDTVNIRVYEPIKWETNIAGVVIPVGGIMALQPFVIQ